METHDILSMTVTCQPDSPVSSTVFSWNFSPPYSSGCRSRGLTWVWWWNQTRPSPCLWGRWPQAWHTKTYKAQKHDDHSEVGATGGEGFTLPFRASGLQGAEGDHIGSDEDEEDGHTHHPTEWLQAITVTRRMPLHQTSAQRRAGPRSLPGGRQCSRSESPQWTWGQRRKRKWRPKGTGGGRSQEGGGLGRETTVSPTDSSKEPLSKVHKTTADR